jgi:glycosyltransferase involved in cell wall biosynthesis
VEEIQYRIKMDASIIVPIYNEESRIKPFLNELKKVAKNSWEIIFVDDGSIDNTIEILKKFKTTNKKVITYKKNKGKGFAVKTGFKAAKGKYLIFIDADGSIHPSQISRMLEHLKKYQIVVGTRALKESKVVSTAFRKFVGIVFNTLSRILFSVGVKDTLCGFKGFNKKAADSLFRNLISDRWVFDVELFYKIRKNKISMYQMPIKWEHRDKSKIDNFEIVKIAAELLTLRIKLLK